MLINDWYDGRIDGIYAIHCYRDALKHLPADVDTYSSARDDIRQALQKRITQGHNGGNANGGGANGRGCRGRRHERWRQRRRRNVTAAERRAAARRAARHQRPDPERDQQLGPKKADSLPIPLLVLGGVAIVLMAAGGAGFLARRTRTRQAQLASAASVPHGPGPEPTEQS